jgi:hypothetical protein
MVQSLQQRTRVVNALGWMVHQRGETSNRLMQFLEVLQGMGKLLKPFKIAACV